MTSTWTWTPLMISFFVTQKPSAPARQADESRDLIAPHTGGASTLAAASE
jgi:hypothetical protein